MKKVILQKGREKSLFRKHPWIFSGAIASTDDNIELGETVHIFSSNNNFICVGAYSPHSQIRVRVWDFNQLEIDKNFFEERIASALNFRKFTIDSKKYNAYRLINSESDGLPGVIVDKYNDILVCQFISAGAEKWKQTIVEILVEKLEPTAVYERSDADVRQKEGLKSNKGMLYGKIDSGEVIIQEDNLSFIVNIFTGHKTGFYLDQRENREIISEYSKGKTVLNCFSYTGGFGIAAAANQAEHVINIDSSDEVLLIAERNYQLNKIPTSKFTNLKADVFSELRKLKSEDRKFDLIILDPPKFVEGKNSLNKASRGYKDINMLAMQLLNEDGLLFTFSCSGLMTPELFNKIIADAAIDAGINFSIINRLWQSVDHRVTTNFPESLYLKGLLIKRN
ncbi:MAG: methyltransferase domain-containing protein [Ignavibacteriales bacterium]|jgi:23S rRNA (cytosine1962-C5)-methyltransferase|nr:MAG: methyltransferase domain-containing protein [Ignavibacteriales bacterium]